MATFAIAIAAVSPLTRKRSFWIVSFIFGVVGCVFLILAHVDGSLATLFKNY
jgi:hypothetical protein